MARSRSEYWLVIRQIYEYLIGWVVRSLMDEMTQVKWTLSSRLSWARLEGSNPISLAYYTTINLVPCLRYSKISQQRGCFLCKWQKQLLQAPSGVTSGLSKQGDPNQTTQGINPCHVERGQNRVMHFWKREIKIKVAPHTMSIRPIPHMRLTNLNQFRANPHRHYRRLSIEIHKNLGSLGAEGWTYRGCFEICLPPRLPYQFLIYIYMASKASSLDTTV